MPVSTADVGPGVPRSGRRRRWMIALVTVALLATATVAGAVVLVGAGTDSTVARWAPQDALVYAEVRADLPGDQRAALGEFLSAFPGFADQASLERKLDELYDRLVSAATEGEQSYTADIAPWFDGQLGVAAGPLPMVTSLEDPAALREAGRFLAIATVDDPATASAWVRATATQAGIVVRTGDAEGTELLLLGPETEPGVAAVTDEVLLLGDEASVRAALARGGADGLATVPAYGEAMDALPGQQAATVYLDDQAYLDWLERLPATAGLDALPADLAEVLPAWTAGGLRIEADALVTSGVMPHPAAAPDTPDARSELPGRLPASTVVLAEVHDLGQALIDGFARWSDAESEAMRAQIEEALRVVGGIDSLAGWIGEGGVAVLADGTEVLPGVVAIPTDATAAENLARSLRNLATLAGLETSEEAYAGTIIVTIDLGPLAAQAWLDAQPIGGAQRSPQGGTMATVSWAVTGDIVAVGVAPSFVKAVLDAPSGDTLAEQARFGELLDRAGPVHRALVWADLDALETLAVGRLEPAERARFETDVRPYLAPLDAFIAVTERDGSYDRSRGLLVLDEGR